MALVAARVLGSNLIGATTTLHFLQLGTASRCRRGTIASIGVGAARAPARTAALGGKSGPA
eukprot:11212132-Lingulodinium_polyedra.AAC.1